MLEPHRNAEVERILGRDSLLHERHQGGVGLRREVGHDRAFGFGVVVEQIDGAARGSNESDAWPFRQPAAVERERGLQHVVERAAIDDAVAFAHGEIGRIVAADRPGVGLRGRLRLRGGAGLDGENRLTGRERATRRLHEGLRAADALDEQDDDAGVRVIDQKMEVVREIEIGLVARGDAIGEAQAAVGAAAQPELQGAARLEDAANRARRKTPEFAVGIAEQPLVIAERAHAVGAGEAELAAGQKILEPGTALD